MVIRINVGAITGAVATRTEKLYVLDVADKMNNIALYAAVDNGDTVKASIFYAPKIYMDEILAIYKNGMIPVVEATVAGSRITVVARIYGESVEKIEAILAKNLAPDSTYILALASNVMLVQDGPRFLLVSRNGAGVVGLAVAFENDLGMITRAFIEHELREAIIGIAVRKLVLIQQGYDPNISVTEAAQLLGSVSPSAFRVLFLLPVEAGDGSTAGRAREGHVETRAEPGEREPAARAAPVDGDGVDEDIRELRETAKAILREVLGGD